MNISAIITSSTTSAKFRATSSNTRIFGICHPSIHDSIHGLHWLRISQHKAAIEAYRNVSGLSWFIQDNKTVWTWLNDTQWPLHAAQAQQLSSPKLCRIRRVHWCIVFHISCEIRHWYRPYFHYIPTIKPGHVENPAFTQWFPLFIKYLDVSLQENMSKIVTCQRLSSNYGKTYGKTNDLVVRRINWWAPPVYQPALVLSSWRLGKFQSDHPHNLSAWLRVNDFTNLPTWSKTTERIPIYNPYPNHHLRFPIWFMVNFKKWAVKLMILRPSPHSITLW